MWAPLLSFANAQTRETNVLPFPPLFITHHSKPKPPEEARRTVVSDFLLRLKKCVSVNKLREIQAQMLLNSVDKANFLIPKAVELEDFTHTSALFSATEEPNHYSFSFMIRGLTNTWHDHGGALSLYRRMKFSGLKPDNFTYDLVSWNSMIGGYSLAGEGEESVGLLRKIDEEGVEPDERTLVNVLGACAHLGDLKTGRLIEDVAVRKKIGLSTFLGPKLISMCGRCGELDSARRVFNQMVNKDRVAWNDAMITV